MQHCSRVDSCPKAYLIFVVFFTQTKFLEYKIYTEKTRKLRQNTQKIANFLRYYSKIHSKWPIFRVKSVKKKNLHEHARGARDKYQVCAKGHLTTAHNTSKHESCNSCVTTDMNLFDSNDITLIIQQTYYKYS